MAAALPFVIPLGADGDPRLGLGFRRIAKKYNPKDVAPREARDERGVLQGPVPRARRPRLESPLQHMIAATAIAQQLLLAALAIWEKDPNDPYALRLCLNAAAFVVDVATHAFLAGGDASAVDGNILQKGHSYSQLVFVALMAAGNCLVVGRRIPRGSATRPTSTGGRRARGSSPTPRSSRVPINIWQTAHGLGAFGLE